MKSFASDNWASVHPKIMQAMMEVNEGHSPAYGEDSHTAQAIQTLQDLFETKGDVYFVWGGTGANVVSLRCLAQPYEFIICSDAAHISVHECNATETLLGAKLQVIPTKDGKLQLEDLEAMDLHSIKGMGHCPQPKVLSLTQCTENGMVYTREELKALCAWAHENELYVHMDGARLSNAAVQLECELADITTHVGVDVLSLGAVKNGSMFGEAVIFLNPELQTEHAKYMRMNSTQLCSKMQFIAAQFQCLYGSELWRENAKQANAMAQKLVAALPHKPLYPVEANMIFTKIPKAARKKVQGKFPFYTLSERDDLCRLVTSFDTTEEDVDAFLNLISND